MSAAVRDEIIRDYERAAAAISSATAGLSEEEASRPIIDRWSVKDHVTHLTLWHEMRYFEINRCAAGRPAAFPLDREAAIETINNTFADLRRHLSFKDAFADLESARSAIVSLVSETPEAGLDPARYQEMGPGGGAQHEIDHAEVIVEARKREGL
jgi:hypothetical protein